MSRPSAPPALVDLRQRVERYLREQFDSAPTDRAGDFMVAHEGAVVWLRPETSTQGHTLVRVWAVTNVDVRVDEEIGRFLLEANGRLPFGGFRLDESRPAVIYADALLGDYLNRAELLIAVAAAVGSTSEFAPRIKERFGGSLFSEI
jgi:hypothetical protein